MQHRSKRRDFLKTAAGSLAVLAGGALLAAPAAAQEKLSPDDPTAKALSYTEDAATVDAAKTPAFKPGSRCANCLLYQAAAAKDGHAPCSAFGGRLVPAKGWCAAWSKAA